MTNSRFSSVTLGLLLAAACLAVLPEDMQARCRLLVGDAVRPGCAAWRGAERQVAALVSQWTPAAKSSDADVARLQTELNAARTEVRRLEIQLAQAQDELQSLRPPLFESSASSRVERLATPVLVDAAVMGSHHADLWRKGRWLEQGKAAGILEEAPILASEGSLLDVGRDAELSPEDRVLCGRCVIGKVAQVGRWTSTFRLVTDAEFRGRAQLVRPTQDGFAFGAKGILKGQGEPLCRLVGIAASASVDVGDLVYTADRDGVLPTPLCYGQVVAANLPDRAREWEIIVEPAPRPADLTHVQVLKAEVNGRRRMAN